MFCHSCFCYCEVQMNANRQVFTPMHEQFAACRQLNLYVTFDRKNQEQNTSIEDIYRLQRWYNMTGRHQITF